MDCFLRFLGFFFAAAGRFLGFFFAAAPAAAAEAPLLAADVEIAPAAADASDIPPAAAAAASASASTSASVSADPESIPRERRSLELPAMRTLSEYLLPISLCAGVFFSTPDTPPEEGRALFLYLLYICCLILGSASSLIAILCDSMWWPREASDKTIAMALTLEIGFIWSTLSFIVLLILHLSVFSLLLLAIMVIVGSILSSGYFWLRFRSYRR